MGLEGLRDRNRELCRMIALGAHGQVHHKVLDHGLISRIARFTTKSA
jgi:hypothetical protein